MSHRNRAVLVTFLAVAMVFAGCASQVDQMESTQAADNTNAVKSQQFLSVIECTDDATTDIAITRNGQTVTANGTIALDGTQYDAREDITVDADGKTIKISVDVTKRQGAAGSDCETAVADLKQDVSLANGTWTIDFDIKADGEKRTNSSRTVNVRNTGENDGSFRLLVSDQPTAIDRFDSLDVSFSKARVFSAGDRSADDSEEDESQEENPAAAACTENVEQAKEEAKEAASDGGCAQQVQTMVCPDEDGYKYEATDGCEISALKAMDWTAAEQEPANDTQTTTGNAAADNAADAPDNKDSDDTPGGFEEFDLNDQTVDLTAVQGTKAAELIETPLEEGRYTRVELHVDEVDGVVDGEEVDVKLPSEKLQITKPFEVGADKETAFVFDISVVEKGQGGYNLLPVIAESGVVGKDVNVSETKGDGTRRNTEKSAEDRGPSNDVIDVIQQKCVERAKSADRQKVAERCKMLIDRLEGTPVADGHGEDNGADDTGQDDDMADNTTGDGADGSWEEIACDADAANRVSVNADSQQVVVEGAVALDGSAYDVEKDVSVDEQNKQVTITVNAVSQGNESTGEDDSCIAEFRHEQDVSGGDWTVEVDVQVDGDSRQTSSQTVSISQSKSGDSDGTEEDTEETTTGQPKCDQEITEAQDAAAGKTCTQETRELSCPHVDDKDGEYTYQAKNGCEISALKERGWVGLNETSVKHQMKVRERSDLDAPTIRASVHLSEQLYAKNGHVSDSEMAKYLAKAFDDAGYNYEIIYNFPPKDTPDETTQCNDAFKWWGAQVTQGRINQQYDATVPPEQFRKDANLLLVDRNSGGCAYIGGKVAIKGGAGIDEVREWQETGHNSDHYIRLLHGGIHEVGHNLGISHKDAGMTWNSEDDRFHRTPMGYQDRENQCGEYNEPKTVDFNGKVVHTLFSECSTSNFQVQESPYSEGSSGGGGQ